MIARCSPQRRRHGLSFGELQPPVWIPWRSFHQIRAPRALLSLLVGHPKGMENGPEEPLLCSWAVQGGLGVQPFCRALHVVGLCGSLAAGFPCCVVPSLPPLSRAGAGASLCCPEVCSGEAKQALRPINCPNNLRNLPGEAFTEPLLPALQCASRFPHPGSILAAGHDVQLGAGAAAAACSTRRAPNTLDQTGTGRSGARETS